MSGRNTRVLVWVLLTSSLGLSGCESNSAPFAPKSRRKPAATEVSADRPGEEVQDDELPVWSLIESESNLVGPAFAIGQLELCPPKSFRFFKRYEAASTYCWVGPIREDETYPLFIVIVTALPPGHVNAPLKALLEDSLAGIRQRRRQWSAKPIEHGIVNGLPFVRSSWEGVATDAAREGLAGRMMHGIVYLTVCDKTAFIIMCQDAAADYAQWLRQGEVAALTVHPAAQQSSTPARSP